MRRVFVLALSAVILSAPASVCAHTRSESHSVWEVNGAGLDLVMTIAEADIELLSHDGERPSDDAVKAYLTERIYPLAGETKCALEPPVETLSATAGFRKYDFTFKCAPDRDIALHSGAFFDVVPAHVNLAQIQNVATGDFTEQLISLEHQTIEMGGDAEHLRRAGFLEFVRMGMMHIFTGVDHMSFLIGLVLISRRLRDLVFVVTGFTIGHSLTLALAVTGILRPHAESIDALVALTIALIGAENIAVASGRPNIAAAAVALALSAMVILRSLGIGDLPLLLLLGAALFSSNYLLVSGHVKDAGRLRLVITLVFGLIHGFGFASNLLEMQLPADRLAELLVGFNLGVEAGQLTLVVGVTGLARLAVRWQLAPPRSIVVDVASALLVAIGTYWFIQRSFL